ncbi:thioredoxin domain-containing protein [Fulvivirga sp.]|uniref:thioredoxin domain-containing protein n=1 Tax=Fulvivirga sp. TaxID=1931237 RepID=UPI0032F0665A
MVVLLLMRSTIILIFISLSFSCSRNEETDMQTEHKTPNHLINETSPYLLQHAYNPVKWYPWGEEALKKAKKEDKPILVSIGYSSCHWCHVMERESFENDSIAEIMNKYFINIKVDREERPDVDQIYMDAVQAMGGNGGWPLNFFLLPDQKPFYGGTYFPPSGWTQLLQNIEVAFRDKRSELEGAANTLTNALSSSDLEKYNLNPEKSEFQLSEIDSMYAVLSKRFDTALGGMDRAPKFPMPGSWQFLLNYYATSKNDKALAQLKLTLDEIAKGGIYDQAGGGFARYSVDAKWLVPHFEKMLYDNGQLVSLYSNAYKLTKSPLYKSVVYQTIDWLKREMTDASGGFYAALDADSEGVEGKFYVWTKEEFDEIVGENAQIMGAYYNISEEGNWEHGNNILHKKLSDQEFADTHGIALDELEQLVDETNSLLLSKRTERVRPGLDDKVLASWNGLMIQGLVDAYEAFGEKEFLNLAVTNANFIVDKMISDGQLKRTFKNNKATIDAYLEDYAFVIQAFTSLYQATFDEKWLQHADGLMSYANAHFFDTKEQFYYFTDNESEALIARKKEVFDNVIPASNSQMAINLHVLGTLLDNEDYLKKSKHMLSSMSSLVLEEPNYTYNWAILYEMIAYGNAEVAIVGNEAEQIRAQFAQHFYPFKILMGTTTESQLPLMEYKTTVNNKTTIYVCYNKTCKLPVNSFKEALKQLK